MWGRLTEKKQMSLSRYEHVIYTIKHLLQLHYVGNNILINNNVNELNWFFLWNSKVNHFTCYFYST